MCNHAMNHVIVSQILKANMYIFIYNMISIKIQDAFIHVLKSTTFLLLPSICLKIVLITLLFGDIRLVSIEMEHFYTIG